MHAIFSRCIRQALGHARPATTVIRIMNVVYTCIRRLALLECVSRAHEIKIYPSSVVRRPSLDLDSWFLSNFSCMLPCTIRMNVVRSFQRKTRFSIFGDFFAFSLTLDPMGAIMSKYHPYIKLLLTCDKLLLNFLLNGPHQSTVLNFWNLELMIFKDVSPEISRSLLYNINKEAKSVLLYRQWAIVERNGVKSGLRG